MEGWEGDTWVSSTTSNPYIGGVGSAPAPADPLESATDEELVFELIKRGYAVAKMDPQDLADAVR